MQNGPGSCAGLARLDASSCPRITDAGASAVARALGPALLALDLAACPALGDAALLEVGAALLLAGRACTASSARRCGVL